MAGGYSDALWSHHVVWFISPCKQTLYWGSSIVWTTFLGLDKLPLSPWTILWVGSKSKYHGLLYSLDDYSRMSRMGVSLSIAIFVFLTWKTLLDEFGVHQFLSSPSFTITKDIVYIFCCIKFIIKKKMFQNNVCKSLNVPLILSNCFIELLD